MTLHLIAKWYHDIKTKLHIFSQKKQVYVGCLELKDILFECISFTYFCKKYKWSLDCGLIHTLSTLLCNITLVSRVLWLADSNSLFTSLNPSSTFSWISLLNSFILSSALLIFFSRSLSFLSYQEKILNVSQIYHTYNVSFLCLKIHFKKIIFYKELLDKNNIFSIFSTLKCYQIFWHYQNSQIHLN